MLKPRIEFDPESYKRRFGSTYSVLNQVNTDKYFTAYIRNIDSEGIVYNTWKKDAVTTYINKVAPIYHPIPSGFYFSEGRSPVLMIKTMRKLFSTGYSKTSHHSYSVDPYGTVDSVGFGNWFPDFITEFVADVPKALVSFGPISDTLWVSARGVYYLRHRIGFRRGSNFIVSPTYLTEVTDCLVNHQCKVNS